MVNTNRIEGLIYLKNHHLPVPDFLKVDNFSNLDTVFINKPSPFGWTIRTCKRNGKNELSLFFKNNLSEKNLMKILKERLSSHTDEYYIIYPSWDFDFSFNLLKANYDFIIEGNMGSQKEISSGIANPNFSLIIDSFSYSIKYTQKDIPSKIKQGVFRAIKLLKDSIFINTYYTEIAITKSRQIYFYEFRDIEKL